MELYQLRAFVVVAEEGHLTRASKRLHASQSTVSGQIKALEDSTGVTLFSRTPRGMVLTRAGSRLLVHVKKVLKAVEDLDKEARALASGMTGTLRVGVNTYARFLRATDLVEHLREDHPGLTCSFVETQSWTARDSLLTTDLDGAFYYGSCSGRKIHEMQLKQVRLIAVAGGDLADKARDAGWEVLKALPWVQTLQHCPFQRVCQDLFDARGVDPYTIMATDSEDALNDLITKGKGVGYLREDVALELAELGQVVLCAVEPVELPLSFGVAEARLRDPAIRALCDAVSRAWELEILPEEIAKVSGA